MPKETFNASTDLVVPGSWKWREPTTNNILNLPDVPPQNHIDIPGWVYDINPDSIGDSDPAPELRQIYPDMTNTSSTHSEYPLIKRD